MKIWNTKYCLTSGITEHEVEDTDSNMVELPRTIGSLPMYLHGEGKDWHRSKEAAFIRAEEIKIKRLLSLDKQIKKISAIEFDS